MSSTTSPPSSISLSQELNLPDDKLVVGERKDYISICVGLYKASMDGDWDAANLILSKGEELVRIGITEKLDTTLHIATSAQHTKFVQLLLPKMDDKDLEIQNKKGNTAFCLAAIAGNVKLMKMMLERNSRLLMIQGSQGLMPLDLATEFGNNDAVNYLYDNSEHLIDSYWTSQNRERVLIKCIEADLFDTAIKILKHHEELAQSESILGVLAQKPYAFEDTKPHWMLRLVSFIFCLKVGPTPKEREGEALKLLRMIWRNINVKMSKYEIHNLLKGPRDTIWKDGKQTIVEKDGRPMYSSKVLFVAVKKGNYKFVVELISQYPDIIWELDENNQSIFHVAVSYRQENIYDLIYEIGPMKDMIIPLIDPHGNNILHLVGMLPKENQLERVPGFLFQMQQELLWFKEVEATIPRSYRDMKNNEGLTPFELFTLSHKQLVASGAKWMKQTASQCMVVAALIATIMFTVAFTSSGNLDGPPHPLEGTYLVFVVADVTSLIFSTASILVFLSITTSPYRQQDFLARLPQKLLIGLTTLFFSILTLMLGFTVNFFVSYNTHGSSWMITNVIGYGAAVTILLYARLQLPLLFNVLRSTFGTRYLFNPKKRMLYNINPRC